jgi:hypothetical protein
LFNSKPQPTPAVLRVTCPCGKRLKLHKSLIGMKLHCPACFRSFKFNGPKLRSD